MISFISRGRQVTIGDLKKQDYHDQMVQVTLTTKHRAGHSIYLGFCVELRRSKDTMRLYKGRDKEFHTVLFQFFLNDYEIEHRRANTEEKEWFASNAAINSVLAQRACNEDKLYIVKFLVGGQQGPEVLGLESESSFVGATDAVNDIYNHLSSVASNSVVDVYLWEYEYIPLELRWSVADQETGGGFSQ